MEDKVIDVKVLAALITSGTAIIVAIISFITALVVNWKSGKQAEKIERLKSDLDKKNKGLQIYFDEITKCLGSLGDIITGIQLVKVLSPMIKATTFAGNEPPPLMKN